MTLRLTGFISTLVYVLYIVLAYFVELLKRILSEKELNTITIILTVIYFIILLKPLILQYRYIYFSADDHGITLRWYKAGLFPGESRSIEIPSYKYSGYQIKKEFFGLHIYLILSEQVQGRRGAYPPVSITALSRTQRKKISEALNNYKSVT